MWMTLDSINLELTSKCNLSCKFCPLRDAIYRKKGIELDYATFTSIIDQGVELGLSRVYLFLFGEPLLCSWFEKGVNYCAKKGIQDIHVTTNGVLLNAKNSEVILRNVRSLTVSMTGATQEIYSKFQGHKSKVNLQKIESNILEFIDLKNRRGHYVDFILSYILNSDSLPGWRNYYDKWIGVVDEIVFADLQVYNLSDFKLGDHNIRNCNEVIARNKLNFLSNGDVTLCCEDFNGELSPGSIHERSLEDIWDDLQVKKMKNNLLSLTYNQLPSVCRNCYMICRYLNFITTSQVKSADRMLSYLDHYFPDAKIALYGANSVSAAMLYTPRFSEKIVAVADSYNIGRFIDRDVIQMEGLEQIDYDILIVNHENTGKNECLTKNALFEKIKALDGKKDKLTIFHSSAGGTDLRGSDAMQMHRLVRDYN